MTNGKSLAKTNWRTIHSLITFLVWFLSVHSTSYNAFVFGVQASQRSPKTPSKTIQLTNNGPATITSSFLQLPNDGPAHFEQLCIPTTKASTGIQADNDCHSILNDVTTPTGSHVAKWLNDVLSSRRPGFKTSVWRTKYNPWLTLVFCLSRAQGAAIFTGSSQETSILFHSHNTRQDKFMSKFVARKGRSALPIQNRYLVLSCANCLKICNLCTKPLFC